MEKRSWACALEKPPRVFFLVILIVLVVYCVHAVRIYKPYTFAYADPGWQVYTAMSLVEDGDLDLRNQLGFAPSSVDDQTSRGVRGEWYPVHEYLMPVFTVPFYWAFGVNGCLLFNILCSAGIAGVLYLLLLLFVPPLIAAAAGLMTAFGTLFYAYSYSYSLDVFSTLLMLISFYFLLRKQYSAAGFSWGLTVLARVGSVLSLAAFIFLLLADGFSSTRGQTAKTLSAKLAPLMRFCLAGVPAAVVFCLANWHMFGGPFDTAYVHWQVYRDEQLVVLSQTALFNRPLINGLNLMLFGLIEGDPLLLVAIPLGLPLMLKRYPRAACAILLLAAVLIPFYAKYEGSPSYGIRYLMPLAALFSIPFALAVQWVVQRATAFMYWAKQQRLNENANPNA
jgi:hypothetical protein